MVFAAELAHRLDLIDADLVARHRSVLERAGLPTSYRTGASWLDLRKAMSLDKKSRGSLAAVRAAGGAGPAGHPRRTRQRACSPTPSWA